MERAFAERKELGSNDFIDHMTFQPSHWLSFGNDNDVLVWSISAEETLSCPHSSPTKLQLNDTKYPGNTGHSFGSQKRTIV